MPAYSHTFTNSLNSFNTSETHLLSKGSCNYSPECIICTCRDGHTLHAKDCTSSELGHTKNTARTSQPLSQSPPKCSPFILSAPSLIKIIVEMMEVYQSSHSLKGFLCRLCPKGGITDLKRRFFFYSTLAEKIVHTTGNYLW